MVERRGLRISDWLVGILLTAVALVILHEPRAQTNPLSVPSLVRDSSFQTDPTLLLSSVGVTTAALVLIGVWFASRLATGRRRVFLGGAALGGWIYFLVSLTPNVDYAFRYAWWPQRWVGEQSGTTTCWLRGVAYSPWMFMS